MHTKNIHADERVSLMVDERKEGDPLEGARVMVMGTCAQSSDQSYGSSYLRRHPEAEEFANFADFAFYRIEIARVHLVAGFGRIVDLKPCADESGCRFFSGAQSFGTRERSATRTCDASLLYAI